MEYYKYHGAGNDFLLADGRGGDFSSLTPSRISLLCDRHYGIGADGLMILTESKEYDFCMQFYNSDGSSGMMCGNGGRCICAFARDLGIGKEELHFVGPDGPHWGRIVSEDGPLKTIELGMKDVGKVEWKEELGGFFLDTGALHFVLPTQDVSSEDVFHRGRELRYHPLFAPVGTNVDFVQRLPFGGIAVRTYERGVEDETCACGTGIVASAICSLFLPGKAPENGHYEIEARALHDTLKVSLDKEGDTFTGIILRGPAVRVGKVLVDI